MKKVYELWACETSNSKMNIDFYKCLKRVEDPDSLLIQPTAASAPKRPGGAAAVG